MTTSSHQYTTSHQSFNPTAKDLRRIARSLMRANISKRYSRGTIKRRAMAMINLHFKSTHSHFSHRSDTMHPAM